ncbi:MAG TPA: CHAT domain-containing protein [Allosphingosinicella sp.]|nr:CHAT domain-containing protein [Allosphingosinicella sp.]
MPFDPAAWQAAPAALGPGAIALYRQLAREGEHGPWWSDVCGGDAPGLRRFLLDLPSDHWERPWEAMIAALDPPRWRDVSIVRRLSGSSAPHPVEIGDQLRILVLQGSEGIGDLDRIDLAAELRELERARDMLDHAVQALVAPFAVGRPGQAEVAGLIAQARPNILWLSGHARADPPGFLLADGTWLTPEELAGAIGAGAAPPLYVVLWACRTGQLQRHAAPRAAPPFIAALAEVGVAAVLATLGPLADDIAASMARTIVAQIAVGRPLDHAVAIARGELMPAQVRDGERDDWACPVIWCIDRPRDELSWAPARAPAQRQLLARKLLPAGLEPADLDAAAAAQAATWSRHDRIWVTSASPARARADWLARVLESQRHESRAVLVFDLSGLDPAHALRDWARMALRRVDEGDDPRGELRRHADALVEDVEQGWLRLCASLPAALVIMQPPDDSPDWLWRGLAQQGVAAIVLARDIPPARRAENWRVETLIADSHADGLVPGADALQSAMAVLAYPAERLDLENAGIASPDLDRLAQEGILLPTRSGWVMPLSRADAIAASLAGDALRRAHTLAYQILSGPRAAVRATEERDEELLKARLQHARAAASEEALAEAAQTLMALYRDNRRANALLAIFESVRGLYRDFSPDWPVSAAWGYIQIGEGARARDWLEAADIDALTPAEAATRHMLIAEIEKMSGTAGSKQRARTALEDARRAVEGDPSDEARRVDLRSRNDLARLTHFFLAGGAAAAIPLYREIDQEWQAKPGSGLDRAIVLRNLAEAEMNVADDMGGNPSLIYRGARSSLDAARDLLPANTGHLVAAEIEYTAARIAERAGDADGARNLLDRCVRVAMATNHFMIAAIAEARKFWMGAPPASPGNSFDPGGWEECAKALDPYRKHAWTARVLINGHLRSARRLLAQAMPRAAAPWAGQAQALIAANEAFDKGGDRVRIAAACAALALAGGAPWRDCLAPHAWADAYLAKHGIDSPEAALEAIG